jgi:hypothetical protein
VLPGGTVSLEKNTWLHAQKVRDRIASLRGFVQSCFPCSDLSDMRNLKAENQLFPGDVQARFAGKRHRAWQGSLSCMGRPVDIQRALGWLDRADSLLADEHPSYPDIFAAIVDLEQCWRLLDTGTRSGYFHLVMSEEGIGFFEGIPGACLPG